MSASRRASVRVPASTSNLGAGFDCVGVAVDRWLVASAVVTDKGGAAKVMMARSGAVTDLAESAADDLVHLGFRLACGACDRAVPGSVSYTVTSTIPAARGLGSSAAALVAGAMLANESLSLRLEREQIASICSEAEHHPDNVGAATFGGAMLSIKGGTSASPYTFSPIGIHRSIALVFAIPDLRIATSAARAALPRSMPYVTTVSAVGKAAALIHGLVTADAALLAYGLDDVVHVPFRSHLIPGYDSVVAAAMSAGAYGATLSGSGSTIVAVCKEDVGARIGAAMRGAWSELGQDVGTIIQTNHVPGASAMKSTD